MEQLHCAGCGVQLQTSNSKVLGYVPEQALIKEPIVCQRCFRIRHYNEASLATLDHDVFLNLLSEISNLDALVVKIVDIFDFEGSIIPSLHRFVGNNPVLLVVNKIDLLPKVTNWNRLTNWVQQQAKKQGLKVIDVVLCSAHKNQGVERFLSALNRYQKGKDVYVVGATNVGKSSLINRLIRNYSDSDHELTISRYPGTTLDLIEIPIDEHHSILDTPGIVYPWRFSEIVEKQDLAFILPEKPLRPVVYQLNEQQTLFFGGFARFDFVSGARQSFTCFVSDQLPIHRTKLEQAGDVYEKHKGKMLSPPSEEHLQKLPAWKKHRLNVSRGARLDVYISGLGWIKVNGETGAVIDVWAPEPVKVLLRNSLI